MIPTLKWLSGGLFALMLGCSLNGNVCSAQGLENTGKKENQMKVTIGTKVFTATLNDNTTAPAFKALLPLTLDMNDLNANEKCFYFPSRLPTEDSNPEKIQSGDLMIWSSNTLVLFYKSFPTPYSYSRIGKIDDPAGLANAVGSGDVKVLFELK